MDILRREPDAFRRIQATFARNDQKMGASEIYRQKADLLLRLSSETQDAKTRAYLLEEALYWHRAATDAAGIDTPRLTDDEGAQPSR